jgi:hypothetical protein
VNSGSIYFTLSSILWLWALGLVNETVWEKADVPMVIKSAIATNFFIIILVLEPTKVMIYNLYNN